MSRSSKKGPYVDEKLLARVKRQKIEGGREAIKTWARKSQIAPEFVGAKLAVHNGRNFVEVFVTEAMVGHRVGEFALTRKFTGHGRVVKRTMEKT